MTLVAHRSRHVELLAALGALLLTLAPVVPAAAQVVQPPATSPAADLPDGKAVMKRMIEAMGGREALDAIKSRHTIVKMPTPMGEMVLETFVADHDRVLVRQSMPGMGEGAMGCNGTVAWKNNPMGTGFELLDADAVKSGSGQADLLAIVLDMDRTTRTMSTVERTEFDGRDCYKVLIVDQAGIEEFRYFDVENGLMLGIAQERLTQAGPIEIVMHLRDWKQIGTVKMFSQITSVQAGHEFAMVLTEIEFNAVPDSTFDLPEEIKALLARQPATQPQTRPDRSGGG